MTDGLLLGTVELRSTEGPLRLPDRFATAFAAGGTLTIWLDGCLALWPAARWRAVADRTLALPIAVGDARAFGRLLFGSAVELRPGPRRLQIPASHRAVAGLHGPAVLVGAGDHLEIWSADRWTAAASRPLDDLALPLAI